MDDYEQIRQLSARYNLAFDTRDADAFVACFTEDGSFEFVETGLALSGQNDLRRSVAIVTYAGRHSTSDHIIEIDGDRAAQRCQLTELGTENGHPLVHRYGRYVDELVRVDGTWRYRNRRLTYG